MSLCETANVSINEVVCYRTERTLRGCCADPLSKGDWGGIEGGSAHPISVLELTRNEVVWGESSLAGSVANPSDGNRSVGETRSTTAATSAGSV